MSWTVNEFCACLVISGKNCPPVIFNSNNNNNNNNNNDNNNGNNNNNNNKKKHECQDKGNYKYPIIISSYNLKHPVISSSTVLCNYNR